MKIVIALFLFFFISRNVSSQLIEQWQQRYNGSANSTDISKAIAIDAAKNVYVTGYSVGIGTAQDFATIKYNSMGVQQWIATYSGFNNDIDNANAIVVDNSNNIIVTGFSLSNGTSYNFTTIKYDPSGNEIWVRKYNGSGNGSDIAKSIVADDSGNVCVTGESYGGIFTSYDIATIKYNSAGVQQWAVRYNGPANGNDGGNSIAIDNSHNIYVTGQSLGVNGNLDIVTIKYNSSGIQQWAANYNGPGNGLDAGVKVLTDNQNYVFVTGYSTGIGSGYDYAVIKYDLQGAEQWVYRFNGSANNNDIITSAALDNSGNIYVTGVMNTDASGNSANYATIKINSSGNAVWGVAYNGPANNNDSATAIAVNNSGEVFVTGKSMGTGTSFDYATVKYNSSGVLQNVTRYNGTGNSIDAASSIALDNFGNTYISGTSIGNGSAEDLLTIKYALVTGVQTNTNINPAEFILEQNYPNPFNPSTIIRYNIPSNVNIESPIVKLIIYNTLGTEVVTLVDEKQSAGNYSVKFDGANYPSGNYYYKLISGDFIQVKKMILMK